MTDQLCPLCERPIRYGRARDGTVAPPRHYKCSCAEFLIDDGGAKRLALFDRAGRQGIIDSANVLSSETNICVITVTNIAGVVDAVLSQELMSQVFR